MDQSQPDAFLLPFFTKSPCPAFWGVAPPNMKTSSEDSKVYFRIKEKKPVRPVGFLNRHATPVA
jgi:hypothetical protein